MATQQYALWAYNKSLEEDTGVKHTRQLEYGSLFFHSICSIFNTTEAEVMFGSWDSLYNCSYDTVIVKYVYNTELK